MFEVYSLWKVPTPPIFEKKEGVEIYKCVRIVLCIYYFIVEFIVDEGDGYKSTDTLLLNSVPDVLGFIENLDEFTVSLFAPRHANSDKELSINTIVEIIQCKEQGQSAYIYKCTNGRTYVDSNLEYTEGLMEDKRTVFLQKFTN